MKLKRPFVLLFVMAILILSCNEDSKKEQAIAKIEADFTVERFDSVLAETNADNIQQAKKIYPFLFPAKIPDSSWIARINEDLQQQMFAEAKRKFGDFKNQESELRSLFQHLKFYDETFEIPRVITVSDDVDYRTKLVVNEKLLIINLMNYLGKDHEFYQNIPVYFSENMEPSQIVSEIAGKYADKYAFQSQRKTLLDEMIYFGKLLYFKDIMIPNISDANKIGYTQDDVKWANTNEAQIWSHFIENEMLFSTNSKLFSRFTVPAPFSKFYLDIDNESPGRIGHFIGWQIVRAYAERTDVDILKLMQTDADEIFNKSKYKPKR